MNGKNRQDDTAPDVPRSMACPVPDSGSNERITLACGEGGRLMRRLIREMILERFGGPSLESLGDAASLPAWNGPLAFTTDSFVVSPLVFPGGDIGSLAVFGTANDLAVSGARPRWISLALIIEEGLERRMLERVLDSAAEAAQRAGVEVVTGDTKVVPRGAADGLFINTSGIGEIVMSLDGPEHLAAGDRIFVTGPVGRHGMAVMVSREGLKFEPSPVSDSQPLWDAVAAIRDAGIPVRAMRDATRGGVAAVLHEWAAASGKTVVVDENALPVTNEVRGACELLGLDPIFVANEGTMVIAASAEVADQVAAVLRNVPATGGTACVGHVAPAGFAPVLVRRAWGQEVPLDEPLGAPLPRIC